MFTERSGRSPLKGCIALSAAIASLLQVSLVLAAETGDANEGLQEIIITAQRVRTSLQETPVSVTAFSADELQERGITSLLDISAFTPNLEVSARSGSASEGGYAIRGMGVNATSPSASPAVGIYIDDAYFPSAVGSLLSLFDVSQVEVLRGPQGTLFGRNTIAGAVQFTTVQPSTDGVSGFLEATGGNEGRADFSGAINLPLGDTVDVRVSLASRDLGGYVHDELNDIDRGSDNERQGRIQLRWTPTDQLTVDLKGEALQQKSNGRPITVIGINPNSFLVGFAASSGALAPPNTPYTTALLSTSDYENAGFNSPEYFNFKYSLGQGTIAYRFNDNITLTSITAYSESVSDAAIDADDTPADILADNTGNDHTDLLTEELRLTGHSFGERFDWTTGVFYYNQRRSIDDGSFSIGLFPASPSPPDSNYDTRAWALYGQGTYHLTTRLSATLGLRYSSETADATTFPPYPASIPGTTCGGGGFAPCGITTGTASSTFTDTSPYVDLDLQLTPDVMTYVKASKGFRAGGYQWLNGVSGLLPFNEESAWTYEAGARMEFLDKRLRVNPTVFYTDWKNIQFNSLDTLGEVFTENAGNAIIKGGELEMQFAPTKAWMFDGSVSYLDGHYTSLNPGVEFETITTPAGPENIVNLALSDPMQQSPRFKYTAGARYTLPLAIQGRVEADANYAWVDTIRSAVTRSDTVQLPSYSLLNAQLQYIAPKDRWRLAVFGTNLTNQYYDIGGVDELNGPGAKEVQPGRPRQYGATLHYNF
jgi:iron complex outermembrane recepter protein